MADTNLEIKGLSTKQRFTINGDKNKVIELDITDAKIVDRLKESINKIQKIQYEFFSSMKTPPDKVSLEYIDKFSDNFSKAEKSMREIIDYIFDSPVSDTILGNKSAFSPINGKFTYDHIISALSKLYEKAITKEVERINTKKIKKYTSKYIK